MTKLLNSSIEFCFESDTMALTVRWLPANSSLSMIDYTDNWIDISKYVEAFNPRFLLINAYEFEYRKMVFSPSRQYKKTRQAWHSTFL